MLVGSFLEHVVHVYVIYLRLIYTQDPWDPATRLEVGDCVTGADGSVTCDTRPPGQPWVETTITND